MYDDLIQDPLIKELAKKIDDDVLNEVKQIEEGNRGSEKQKKYDEDPEKILDQIYKEKFNQRKTEFEREHPVEAETYKDFLSDSKLSRTLFTKSTNTQIATLRHRAIRKTKESTIGLGTDSSDSKIKDLKTSQTGDAPRVIVPEKLDIESIKKQAEKTKLTPEEVKEIESRKKDKIQIFPRTEKDKTQPDIVTAKGRGMEAIKKQAEETRVVKDDTSKQEAPPTSQPPKTSDDKPKILVAKGRGMEAIKKQAEETKLSKDQLEKGSGEDIIEIQERSKQKELKPQLDKHDIEIFQQNIEDKVNEKYNSLFAEKQNKYQEYLKDVRDQNKKVPRDKRKVPMPFSDYYKDDVLRYQAKSQAAVDLEKKYPQRLRLIENNLTEPPNQPENFRSIKAGEAFLGSMPILKDIDKEDFLKFQSTYGDISSIRKYEAVHHRDATRETIFFDDPKSIKAAYEMEFAKRHGGKAGLPKFMGVVPHGYQLERIQGKSLQELIDDLQKKYRNEPDNARTRKQKNQDFRKLLTKEQGQELLEELAKYHKETGQTHSGELDYDNIFITDDDHIKLGHSEFRDATTFKLTPEMEMKNKRKWLRKSFGIKTSNVATIKTREAKEKAREFKKEVEKKLIFAKKRFGREDKTKVIEFREPSVDILIQSGKPSYGTYLVNTSAVSEDYVPASPASTPTSFRSRIPIINRLSRPSTGRARSALKTGIKKVSGRAGQFIGNKVVPFAGGKVGKFIGEQIGDIDKMKKRFKKTIKIAAALIAAWGVYIISLVTSIIVQIIVGFILFVFLIFTIIFIINAGAYVVPPGELAYTAYSPPRASGPGCPSGWPVNLNTGARYVITQGPYSSWTHGGREAIDVTLYPYRTSLSYFNPNAIVISTHEGTVTAAQLDGYGGLWVQVSGNCAGTDFRSWHVHFYSITATWGQQVSRGTRLGYMGRTGWAKALHDHYEFPDHFPVMAPDFIPAVVPIGCGGATACGNIYIP
jgi:hypothetical protein